jgi:type IV pilus biogenesis protein CpaD/CtpE
MKKRTRTNLGLAVLLALLASAAQGCTSAPSATEVIAAKLTYETTANTLILLKPQFTPEEGRLIAAADDEAYAAVKLMVARFVAGEPVTSADVRARFRSALVRLARWQFEGEARRAGRATTRPT